MVDCKIIWLDSNVLVVVAVMVLSVVAVMTLAAMSAVVVVVVAVAAIGDKKMEDTNRLFRCESNRFSLIVVAILFCNELIECNATEPILLGENVASMVAVVVVVLSITKFGCSLVAIDDDNDDDDDVLEFDRPYSYFKTDVGLIDIDEFVLCLFSMIDVVSLAILDPSTVAFDMPKCSDCCLKVD